jgi:hypothetical protein
MSTGEEIGLLNLAAFLSCGDLGPASPAAALSPVDRQASRVHEAGG